jgi:hypothetical protein
VGSFDFFLAGLHHIVKNNGTNESISGQGNLKKLRQTFQGSNKSLSANLT